ncbi:ATP-binding protein [Candidatus Poribacteria bacterium]|jgi:hypothetical protein|nr:ATP-binding protein [Candidatus Poribacteria bacterium]MBT5536280.1 ATP-binding protein [Candidatus Poribacteria bacterium]MBT7101246.1 ATP-binding protein [Candidatus Poribacteria bacterium]
MAQQAWQNLRAWKGSQTDAFEELCCQLAAHEDKREPVLAGAKFVRKGTPDAGVECYWTSPELGEWAWQAKFFLNSPTAGQWGQIDKSVKTALSKHGQALKRYYVCLPTDLSDPRRDDQTSAKDQWDTHVEKWDDWAAEDGVCVEFVYWGSHEISERLSREEHAGRRYFWFNDSELSQGWFEQRLAEAESNAGARYTPELNVELPIAGVFDGLGRTAAFFRRIQATLRDLNKHLTFAVSRKAQEAAGEACEQLSSARSELDAAIRGLDQQGTDELPLEPCVELVDRVDEARSECGQELLTVEVEIRGDEGDGTAESRARIPERLFATEQHGLGEARRTLREMRECLSARGAQAANTKALLVVGDAGVGKTHLLRDVAQRRLSDAQPTVLLRGSHFLPSHPWPQIVAGLGLSCSTDELLGALDACAEATDCRALILIDALNEGSGRDMWQDHIAGMLTTLRRYPRVALAVSVRTSYEDLVIPQQLAESADLTRAEHDGFAGHEYEATQTFFRHFNVPAPSFPHLAPEFSNPLFLVLLCRALGGLSPEGMPSGEQGMSAVFGRFLDRVNERLSRSQALDFDGEEQYVHRAVLRFSMRLADTNVRAVPRHEARELVNQELQRTEHSRTLFKGMLDEGVLIEDRRRLTDGEPVDVVLLSYERFSDYMIARHLIDQHMDPASLDTVFRPGGSLHDGYVRDGKCWDHAGVMEALSVLIPETFGRELLDIVPERARAAVLAPFIWSIVWRSPSAFTESTRRVMNTEIAGEGADPDWFIFDQFVESLLTVAATPGHPYNADKLHLWLGGYSLASRDAWWSTYLHRQYGEKGAVERLLRWAWSTEGHPSISDKAARLACTALAWMLTTSNRSVRDRATKGLVCLLQGRVPVLQDLLGRFADVDDPYVLERLHAVAYGCALRTSDDGALAELALDIYARIFADGRPPAHILLRDYARGVIEAALYRGLDLGIDVEKVRPPYASDWPSDIPTADEVDAWRNYAEDASDVERTRSRVASGAMSSDFARYIVRSSLKWSRRALGEPKPPTSRELVDQWCRSLTNRQAAAYGEYTAAVEGWREGVPLRWIQIPPRRRSGTPTGGAGAETGHGTEPEAAANELADAKKQILYDATTLAADAVRKTLRGRKREDFDAMVVPYLVGPRRPPEQDRLDESFVLRAVVKRVLDLGWTDERFAEFDREVSHGRWGSHGAQAERIGKKYLWIAYHEMLARVSDRFAYSEPFGDDPDARYEGPWQVGRRDVDPSVLARAPQEDHTGESGRWWWVPHQYSEWQDGEAPSEWVQERSDLPHLAGMLDIPDPDDGSGWVLMRGVFTWERPTSAADDRYEVPRRHVVLRVQAYVVHSAEMEAARKWCAAQDPTAWTDLGPRDIREALYREFPWAEAARHGCPAGSEWQDSLDWETQHRALPATDLYVFSGDPDCSGSAHHIAVPSAWLCGQLGLTHTNTDGEFSDPCGATMAVDPSVSGGPEAVLMRADRLREFVAHGDHDILWEARWVKEILGGWDERVSYGRMDVRGFYTMDQSGGFSGSATSEHTPPSTT